MEAFARALVDIHHIHMGPFAPAVVVPPSPY